MIPSSWQYSSGIVWVWQSRIGVKAAVGELTEEVIRQVTLERPFAEVGAEVQRVIAANPCGGIADIPHRLKAGRIIVDRAAVAGKPRAHTRKTDRRVCSLDVWDFCEDVCQSKRVNIRLRRCRSMLVSPGLNVTQAKLIHEIGAERNSMGDLPAPGLLNE